MPAGGRAEQVAILTIADANIALGDSATRNGEHQLASCP